MIIIILNYVVNIYDNNTIIAIIVLIYLFNINYNYVFENGNMDKCPFIRIYPDKIVIKIILKMILLKVVL